MGQPISESTSIAAETVEVESAVHKKTEAKKNSKKNAEEPKVASVPDAASIAGAIKSINLKEEDIQSLLDLLVQRQASVSDWRPANGGMDAAAIFKKQLEEKDRRLEEILNLN